jgi:hypothetical protein
LALVLNFGCRLAPNSGLDDKHLISIVSEAVLTKQKIQMFFKKKIELKKTITELPLTGSVYSFRTSPWSEFAAPETGRYAAFKILATNEKLLALAVLDKVWSAPPTLHIAEKAAILHERRFAHTGRLAAFGVNSDFWVPSDLDSIFFLGTMKLSRDEKALGAKIISFSVGCHYSTLNAANSAAEGEWRWEHDHDALVAESVKEKEKADARRKAEEERYKTRLTDLTWEKLLTEMPFERWSPSPPFPPIEFVEAAREKIHETCRALRELGLKPPKAKVRAILRDCVEWFNEADEAAGGVIETEERDDICVVLEEMAFVTKQKSLLDEIDNWRQW